MKKRNFSIHYGWIVLVIGVLGIFCAIGLGRFGYATILPNMQAGLKIDNGEAGLLTAVGLIGYLAFSTIGGALASRYGGRLVVSLDALVFIFTSLVAIAGAVMTYFMVRDPEHYAKV